VVKTAQISVGKSVPSVGLRIHLKDVDAGLAEFACAIDSAFE